MEAAGLGSAQSGSGCQVPEGRFLAVRRGKDVYPCAGWVAVTVL